MKKMQRRFVAILSLFGFGGLAGALPPQSGAAAGKNSTSSKTQGKSSGQANSPYTAGESQVNLEQQTPVPAGTSISKGQPQSSNSANTSNQNLQNLDKSQKQQQENLANSNAAQQKGAKSATEHAAATRVGQGKTQTNNQGAIKLRNSQAEDKYRNAELEDQGIHKQMETKGQKFQEENKLRKNELNDKKVNMENELKIQKNAKTLPVPPPKPPQATPAQRPQPKISKTAQKPNGH